MYFLKKMDKLTDLQLDVINECLEKTKGCINIPMGSGKTLIGLCLGIKINEILRRNGEPERPILIVCSKTLLLNWSTEIGKFFGDKLQFQILHTNYVKELDNFRIKSKFIITTPEVISKTYKESGLDNITSQRVENVFANIKRYFIPEKPYRDINIGTDVIFSTEWSCLIVDEIQNYTNINTMKCRALMSIYAKNRWGMSGTPFPEPLLDRIFGYYMILNLGVADTLPDMKSHLKNPNYAGLNSTMVVREKIDFTLPNVNEDLVYHDLFEEEVKIYQSMKCIMGHINALVKQYKTEKDSFRARLFSSYKIAMITYLRQSIICPLIPITSAALDISDLENKSQLSQMLMDKIKELQIDSWLDDEESVKSSRIRKMMETIEKYKNDKILMFFTSRACLDLFKHYIEKKHLTYTLTSDMNVKKRENMVNEFTTNPSPSVMLLTYKMGAEGLNLQAARTVILADMYWNYKICQQALGRCLRKGQLSSYVNVVYYVSNTGIENIILDKQMNKLELYNKLKVGSADVTLKKTTLEHILKIVDIDKNIELLNGVINFDESEEVEFVEDDE